jgi:DnaJ-class molecular chaperone
MAYEYYEVLGVHRNASINDIKKAYRKKATSEHPDKGGNAEKFAEITNAYHVLSNDDRKNKYDQMGGNEQGSNQQQHQHSHEEMFSRFFNNQGRGRQQQEEEIKKCSNIVHRYNITMEDVFKGVNKQLNIKIKACHFHCFENCNVCQGKGIIKNMRQTGPFCQIFQSECESCKGNGVAVIPEKEKEAYYEKEETINLKIPKGVNDNTQIIIQNFGEQPKKKEIKAGDLIFAINIENNTNFRRVNNDLHTKISIDYISAVSGTNITLDIFKCDTFIINTFKLGILQSNKEYKFKNKGMPFDNNRGDLYVEFIINYPILSKEKMYEIKASLEKILS